MAIQTSDGEVFKDGSEFIKSMIYDPNRAQHSQPSLDTLFNQLSTQPTPVDPNGNPVQDKNHSDSGQFQVADAGPITDIAHAKQDMRGPISQEDKAKQQTRAVLNRALGVDNVIPLIRPN